MIQRVRYCGRSARHLARLAVVDTKNLSGHRHLSTNMSDRDLQLKFYSAPNWIRMGINFLLRWEVTKFEKFRSRGLLPASIPQALSLYFELQNPLLLKYNIQPLDFIKGATYGFEVMYRAISAKDFSDKVCGLTDRSDSYDLLQDTANTTLFNAFQDACRELHKKGVVSRLVELEVQKATMLTVSTTIVPGDIPEGTEMMFDAEREQYLKAVKYVEGWMGDQQKRGEKDDEKEQKPEQKQEQEKGKDNVHTESALPTISDSELRKAVAESSDILPPKVHAYAGSLSPMAKALKTEQAAQQSPSVAPTQASDSKVNSTSDKTGQTATISDNNSSGSATLTGPAVTTTAAAAPPSPSPSPTEAHNVLTPAPAPAPSTSAPVTPTQTAQQPAAAAPQATPTLSAQAPSSTSTPSSFDVRPATRAPRSVRPALDHSAAEAPVSSAAPAAPIVSDPGSSFSTSAPKDEETVLPAAAKSDRDAATEGAFEGHNSEPTTPAAGGKSENSDIIDADVVSTEPVREEFLSAYPPGSVVATVTMEYVVKEQYETSISPSAQAAAEGRDLADNQVSYEGRPLGAADVLVGLGPVRNGRTHTVTWTYRGCISGQVPLQWRLVSFDGAGGKHSKY